MNCYLRTFEVTSARFFLYLYGVLSNFGKLLRHLHALKEWRFKRRTKKSYFCVYKQQSVFPFLSSNAISYVCCSSFLVHRTFEWLVSVYKEKNSDEFVDIFPYGNKSRNRNNCKQHYNEIRYIVKIRNTISYAFDISRKSNIK